MSLRYSYHDILRGERFAPARPPEGIQGTYNLGTYNLGTYNLADLGLFYNRVRSIVMVVKVSRHVMLKSG
jgi:hypothetical protein